MENKLAKPFSRKHTFLLLKNLTDFRKTVETGMDRRLRLAQILRKLEKNAHKIFSMAFNNIA